MAVVTGLLTINAAFLREIKEDNRRLHDLLERAGQLFVAPPSDDVRLRRVAEVLGEVRDQLALHFTLEEAYGYFEDALEAAPNLSERATALRAQHAELFAEACDLVEEAERNLYHETARRTTHHLAERFHRWHNDLRQHESAEATLIADALNDEIGVGD
jgi:predicted nuclease with TOPRIM domain